ncbi:Ribosome-releasing factor 2, mitochondrial, partial [Spiromyces aspiralis]
QRIERVRNFGIIAHIDAGKTTTTERMLYYAGFTRKLGDVDHGDTVMDYLPAERERGITITSATITFGWKDHLFHLIDSPGHVDFTVEVERAMRVLDGAVTILDAVSGVQAQTKTVWQQASRYQIPRLVFVNKMDREGANFERCYLDVQNKLGMIPLVCQLPNIETTGDGTRSLLGIVDVIDMEHLSFDQRSLGASVARQRLAPGSELHAAATKARTRLIETLAELDHQIVDMFFSDEVGGDHLRMPSEEVHAAIRRVTVASQACPVLLGASYRNFGVQPVMDAVNRYLPSPLDRPSVQYTLLPGSPLASARQASKGGAPADLVPLDPNAPLVAFAFKVVVDRRRGPMVYVRVYSGTLNSRKSLINATCGGVKERATKLLQMYADLPEEIPEIRAGHIGVVLGLKATRTGDTLLSSDHPSIDKTLTKKLSKTAGASKRTAGSVKGGAVASDSFHTRLGDALLGCAPVGLLLHGLTIPPPVFFCSVEAHSPSDEKPLMDALESLVLEDPSLKVSVDNEIGQTLLSGMGELHLEVIKGRLLDDMKVNATVGKMQISYRESVGEPKTIRYVYERDVGGRPAKAGIALLVEPLEAKREGSDAGDGIEIDTSAVEGSLLRAFDAYANNNNNDGGVDGSALSVDAVESISNAIHDGLYNGTFRGPVLGFPVTLVKASVMDVEYFSPELSTPAAFRTCALMALRRAIEESKPQLLEPIMRVSIQCEDEHIGAVLSDLGGVRRGKVASLSEVNVMNGVKDGKLVVADIPLSLMIGYATTLRSLTAGHGTFTMEVLGFDYMPSSQQAAVIKEARGY